MSLSPTFRLASERLIIRPFMDSAADALTDLRQWADDRGRSLPKTIGPRQLKRYREGLAMASEIEEYRLGGYLKNGGAFVVNIEMSPQSLDPIHHLSVHTMRAYRGQGYGGEIIRAVLPFFRAVDGKGIIGLVKRDNAASLRMMEKLGYAPQGMEGDFHRFVLK